MDINTDMTPQEGFLVQQDRFRYNAVMIIRHMLYWSEYTPESQHLVDEILHSIFFLGQIKNPNCDPEDIFTNDLLNALREKYPRPFECFRTHVPKRSPFSCVLDMIVLREGQDQVDTTKNRLKEFVEPLKRHFLVSSTMCVTTTSNSNYYGVSMSARRIPNAAEIMIAASCLSYWDEYVAGAVMTYYPESTDFDGTIELPDSVTCKTFTIENLTEKEACKHCNDLFGLPTTNTVSPTDWKHGNCAEVESVSNLFKNENDVKNQAEPTSTTYTAENLNQAVGRVHKVLRDQLLQLDFQWPFYKP